jgi:hypothetical protein
MSNTLSVSSGARAISSRELWAMARRGHFVLALVTLSADSLAAATGIDRVTIKSRLFSVGFLFELAGVMQLRLWEDAGFTVHIDAGLPSADTAAKELEHHAKVGESHVAGIDLWRKVTIVWREHFAWEGQQLLGSEVAIHRADDDLLVEQLAQFMWRNRRALTAGQQDKETNDE